MGLLVPRVLVGLLVSQVLDDCVFRLNECNVGILGLHVLILGSHKQCTI